MSADIERWPPPNDPVAFESLCLDLWKEIWGVDSGAQKHAGDGQGQTGVDVLGRYKHQWVGVQCKQKDGRARLKVKELEEEVEAAKKFEPPLAKFIVATTCSRDAKLQKRARELTELHQEQSLFTVEVWSWEEIWPELHMRSELMARITPIYWPLLAKEIKGQTTRPYSASMGKWRICVAGVIIIACLSILLLSRSRNITLSNASALFEAKQYVEAFAAYSGLSDRDLKNIDLHRRVEECAKRGHLGQLLVERYRGLIRTRANDAVLRNFYGNALLATLEIDQLGIAEQQYREALRIEPTFAPPRLNLGIIALRQERSNEAQTLFEQYVGEHANDPVAWVNLAVLHTARFESNKFDQESHKSAIRCLHNAHALEPRLASVHKVLGRLFAAEGRLAESLSAYENSLAVDDEQPDVRSKMQELAARLGRDLVAWDSSDDLQPRSAQFTEIVQSLNNRRFLEAEKSSQELVRRYPSNALAWRIFSSTLNARGRSHEAQQANLRALEFVSKQTYEWR